MRHSHDLDAPGAEMQIPAEVLYIGTTKDKPDARTHTMNLKSLSLVGGGIMMLAAAIAMVGGAEKIPRAPLALLQLGMATVLISMVTKERSW